MADPDATRKVPNDVPDDAGRPAPAGGTELSDEQLDKVSGGVGGEFTSVSNVLKTRHDTAKNSIGNVR